MAGNAGDRERLALVRTQGLHYRRERRRRVM